MFDDLVLVVCGGAAVRIVRDNRRNIPLEPLYIDSNDKNSSLDLVSEGEDCRGDEDLSFMFALDNADAIRSVLEGKRIAFIFSMLGGGAGTGMVPVLINLAQSCGCRAVCILGLPWQLEPDRRRKAVEALGEEMMDADRLLLLDIDMIPKIYPDVRLDIIMTQISHSVSFAIANLADMADGPFFSTFSQKMYTFAYTSDMDPDAAVEKAMDATMFETDPTEGKVIVTVSSGFGDSECEMVFDKIVSMSGIIPEIVKRTDAEDTKVLVFIPVKAH